MFFQLLLRLLIKSVQTSPIQCLFYFGFGQFPRGRSAGHQNSREHPEERPFGHCVLSIFPCHDEHNSFDIGLPIRAKTRRKQCVPACVFRWELERSSLATFVRNTPEPRTVTAVTVSVIRRSEAYVCERSRDALLRISCGRSVSTPPRTEQLSFFGPIRGRKIPGAGCRTRTGRQPTRLPRATPSIDCPTGFEVSIPARRALSTGHLPPPASLPASAPARPGTGQAPSPTRDRCRTMPSFRSSSRSTFGAAGLGHPFRLPASRDRWTGRFNDSQERRVEPSYIVYATEYGGGPPEGQGLKVRRSRPSPR